MAFPSVATATSGRTTASNTTSHAITLPSGISAGNLLLVAFAVDANPTVTVNTGVSGPNWTKLGQTSNTGADVTGAIFWKIAAGGDALTLTTDSSEQSSHTSYRITGASKVTGAAAQGSSTNSDPPNLSGPYSTQDYLWIVTRAGDSTTVATVAPTNFTNFITLAAAGTNGASSNSAEYQLNASSQNPGTFTSATEQWVSYTLCVVPIIDVTITGTVITAAFSNHAGLVGGLRVLDDYNPALYLPSGSLSSWFNFSDNALIFEVGTTTHPDDGEGVNHVYDKSNYKWNWTSVFQAYGADWPVIRTNSIATTKQSVDFNMGVDARLTLDAFSWQNNLFGVDFTDAGSFSKLTFGIVYKVDSLPASTKKLHLFYYKLVTSAGEVNIYFYVNSSGQWAVDVDATFAGGSQTKNSGSNTITLGAWTSALLSLNYVSNELSLYVNNLAVIATTTFGASGAVSWSDVNLEGEITIGMTDDTTFDGNYADFFIATDLMDSTQRYNWFSAAQTYYALSAPNVTTSSTALTYSGSNIDPVVSAGAASTNVSFTGTAQVAAFTQIAPTFVLGISNSVSPLTANFVQVDPTLSLGTSSTLSVQTGTLVQLDPSLSLGASASLSALVGSLVQNALTIVTDHILTITNLNASFVQNSPVIIGESISSTSVLEASFIQNAPENITDQNLSPATLLPALVALDPTASGESSGEHITITGNVFSQSVVQNDVTTLGDSNFIGTAQVGSFNQNVPQILNDFVNQLDTLSITVSPQNLTVALDWAQSISAQSFSSQLYDPNVFYDFVTSLNALVGNFSNYDPTVQGSALIETEEQVANFSQIAPANLTDQSLSVNSNVASFVSNDPSILFDWVQVCETLNLDSDLYDPQTITSAILTLAHVLANFEQLDPDVSGSSLFEATRQDLTVVINAASILFDYVQSLTAQNVTIFTVDPQINLDYQNSLTSLVGNLSQNDPSTITDQRTELINLNLALQQQDPSVIGQAISTLATLVADTDSLDPAISLDQILIQTALNVLVNSSNPANITDQVNLLSSLVAAFSLLDPFNAYDWLEALVTQTGTLNQNEPEVTGTAVFGAETLNLISEQYPPSFILDQVLTLVSNSGVFEILNPDTGNGTLFSAPTLSGALNISDPEIEGVSNVSVGSLDITSSTSEPSIIGIANIDVAALVANLAQQGVQIFYDWNESINTLSGDFSIQDPNLITESLVGITTLSGALNQIDPAVIIHALESISSQILSSNFSDPVIIGEALTQVSFLAGILSQLDPSVQTEALQSLSTLAANFQSMEPIVQAGSVVFTTVLDLSSQLNSIQLLLDYAQAVDSLVASLSTQNPGVSTNSLVNLSELELFIQNLEPSVSLGSTTTLTELEGLFSLYDPTLDGSILVDLLVLSSTLTELDPTVTVEADVEITLSELSATWGLNPVTVSFVLLITGNIRFTDSNILPFPGNPSDRYPDDLGLENEGIINSTLRYPDDIGFDKLPGLGLSQYPTLPMIRFPSDLGHILPSPTTLRRPSGSNTRPPDGELE